MILVRPRWLPPERRPAPLQILSMPTHYCSHLIGSCTDQYRDQIPVDVNDDPEHPLPLSDDAFLDVRVAVVAHGRKAYDAVLTEPKRFATVWPFELGANLVEAVGEAYECSTGEPWPALNPDLPEPS